MVIVLWNLWYGTGNTEHNKVVQIKIFKELLEFYMCDYKCLHGHTWVL